jgi:uncharacterized membrane protein YhaH (DUF805 family)
MPLFELLFSFSGRIGRKSWWTGLAIGLVAAVIGSMIIDPGVWLSERQRAPSPALALWDLAWVIPMTAITVKRFNDRGWPEWLGYLTGMLGILLIVAEQSGFMVDPDEATRLEVATFAAVFTVLVAAFIDNAFIKGTPGPNRHGDDPLNNKAV